MFFSSVVFFLQRVTMRDSAEKKKSLLRFWWGTVFALFSIGTIDRRTPLNNWANVTIKFAFITFKWFNTHAHTLHHLCATVYFYASLIWFFFYPLLLLFAKHAEVVFRLVLSLVLHIFLLIFLFCKPRDKLPLLYSWINTFLFFSTFSSIRLRLLLFLSIL